MAGVKKEDIPEIAAFMSEVWTYMKSVWIPEDDDGYWKEAVDRADALSMKYEDSFCRAYIGFILDYLDWKQKKGQGKTTYEFHAWLHMRYKERAKTCQGSGADA